MSTPSRCTVLSTYPASRNKSRIVLSRTSLAARTEAIALWGAGMKEYPSSIFSTGKYLHNHRTDRTRCERTDFNTILNCNHILPPLARSSHSCREDKDPLINPY